MMSALPIPGAADPAAMVPGFRIGDAIRRSGWRAILRAQRLSDGAAVVLKTVDAEYPARLQVAALRREFQLVERLQEVPAVIRVHGTVPYGNGNLALVSECFGRSLASLLAETPGRGLPLPQALDIAIAVAGSLAQLHERDVVHKNIEPHSILVDDAGTIRLIDFAIASEIAVERKGGGASQRLEGALPYMSPEQTGRMNRDLDYRSDYYSLGATLFELLTGRLPFQANSALEWVHNHISRLPPSPTQLQPAIPPGISAIVLKLMAKNAEDRYQSSFGLIDDLDRCRRELAQTGIVSSFALGRRDVPRRFSVPEKLYGRERELAVLLCLFEEVAAGGTAFCMVSGYSGVGKSALVNEISKPLVGHRGYLICGKFDQFQRGTPYSAVAVALRGLVAQLSTESEARRSDWREKFVAAASPNARVLTDLVPELEGIIGPQPAVAELPPAEALNRFHLAVLGFIRVVTAEQPLVLFLDDLQFSDASTLNLLRWLGAARDLQRLLLIGAYRSNEVDVGHPLRLALEEIEQHRPVRELSLQPLGPETVQQLVADALYAAPAESGPLAQLLHERAEGNPFFLTEMLRMLERSKTIAFDPGAGRWRWDMDAVRRAGMASNVVDFVVANLRRLAPATQRVLQLAACIGNSFDLRTLAVINERSMDDTGEALLPALQRNMILPLSDDYMLVGRAAGAAGQDDLNPTYRFQHDRVQQAAYALIDAGRQQAVHLSVGRLMLQSADARQRRERLIEIVGHLNEGRRLIEDPGERVELARMNLAAAVQAQRSSAYESAFSYVRAGEELLPQDAWSSQPELAMALATEHQQCAYLTARYDEAETWLETMLAHARGDLERAEILSMRTRQYATTGKMEASIRAAIAGLALLGVRIADRPDRAAVRREVAAVRRNLAGRRIAALIDAPALTDARQKVAIRLLMEIFPAAFLSGSGDLFPLLVLKSVNISLRHGTSPESAFAYAAYGMLLCGALDDPALGFEYGELAVAMNDRLADIALKSRVIYVYAMFVHHWSRHWSSMTAWFRRGIEAGYESGDLLYLAYSAQDCVIWDPKLDLETAEREHADLLKVVRDTGYQDSRDSGTLFLQMQRNFLGRTAGLCSLSDADFDEQRCLEGMQARKFMTGVANYHIYKAEICRFYGDHEQALRHVRAQDGLMASAMSLPQLARYYIVAFLTLAACLPGFPAGERRATLRRLRADLRRMKRWAANCPENFLHLVRMMAAELARLDGRIDAALRLYEQAAELARTNEFRRDEALANELAGRHLWDAGRRRAAEGYLRAARNLYDRWGARRKVEHLDAEFAPLRRPTGTAAGAAMETTRLDMASVMKASQAISGEIVLQKLWPATMRIMLENAGGQRGCFVVRKEGVLAIEGLSDIGLEATAGGAAAPAGADGELAVPLSIVQHVLSAKAPLVINDATEEGPFARDAYVVARRPRSVLCVPLAREGRMEGAIYMENGLAAGAFTEERVEVVNVLAGQVSIAIENARLYEAQARLIEAQRRFVPSEFLESLNHRDIARVDLGENVAKRMSVMFADLRGFTPLAERLDPRSVIEILNRFFAGMEQAIAEAGGFIDSFAGDEIKVLFDTAPEAAVRGGIAMWRRLDELNLGAAQLGQPALNMGVGVNSGPVVLGTVGSRNRIQCSVLGDTVNLASRIEQLTKVYGARLLISEQTYLGIAEPGAFSVRLVDRVAVKGRVVAVGLYDVIDADGPARRGAKEGTRPLLQSAIERYTARDFGAARAAFARMLELDPGDPVPALFLERCDRYLSAPPPDDWQGFERLTHK
jgi:predicted ATPase/class 3 adenylate cyclase